MNNNDAAAGTIFFLLAIVFFFLWRREYKKRIALEKAQQDRLLTAVMNLTGVTEQVALQGLATFEIMKEVGRRAGIK
jgi:hypothetical protein